ncbi:MAG: hypothetical protein ACE145_04065 [Terriglobia bacterium]
MWREKIRTVFSFHVALGAILVLWLSTLAEGAIWDSDIWWHLRNADYLLTHHAFPQADMFSFTVPGHPWLNHEWLSEIPYLLAWRAAGPVGIFLLFLSLLAINIIGVYYLACRASGNPKAAFLVTAFGELLMKVSFGPRTILYGYIFILILLMLLRRYRTTGQAPLWVIPPMFCLWINTHGSWLLGLFIFGIIIACGLVEGQWGRVEAERWTPSQLRRLIATMAASIVALFVNPFTYRLVVYPFDLMFRQKLNIAVVDEWASVDFNDARGKVVLILLAGVLAAALFSRVRWKLEELALAVFGLYAGLVHIRFLFLAAILLVPLLARIVDFLPPYQREVDKPALNAVVVGVVLLIVMYRFPSAADLNQVIVKRFPENAVKFFKEHGLSGRVFNRYMWGGYLIWFHPEIKTFIDSRTDIFEYAGILKDYMDAETMVKPLEVLDKYQIRYVLIPPDAPLAYLLRNHAGWRPIYGDSTGMILERITPAPPAATPPGEEPPRSP